MADQASDFEEFPKMMTHPAWRKSEVTITENSGNKVTAHGTPDAFPPVLVHSADQEDQHRAMGYETRGKSDPNAFAVAAASPPPPNYQPAEYPKWVNGVLCADEDEELEAMDKPNVVALAAAPAEPAVSDEVADLRAQLAAMQAQLDAAQVAPKAPQKRKAPEAA